MVLTPPPPHTPRTSQPTASCDWLRRRRRPEVLVVTATYDAFKCFISVTLQKRKDTCMSTSGPGNVDDTISQQTGIEYEFKTANGRIKVIVFNVVVMPLLGAITLEMQAFCHIEMYKILSVKCSWNRLDCERRN